MILVSTDLPPLHSSDYDGGDCCECTCDPTKNFWDDDGACGRWSLFACIDPAAECVDDDSVTADMIDICSTGNIGDGYCSPSNNSPECGMSYHACQLSEGSGHTPYKGENCLSQTDFKL